MATSLQVLMQKGTLAAVPAGQRVRIAPQEQGILAVEPALQDANGVAIPIQDVIVNGGFQVLSKGVQLPGEAQTFDVQNTNSVPANLEWTAFFWHSDQYNSDQAIQTTVGNAALGGANPSPLAPVAQGMFFSTVQVGTGAPQTVAHGLGRAPTRLVIAVSGAPGAFTSVLGAVDATNVTLTVTVGVSFQIIAI